GSADPARVRELLLKDGVAVLHCAGDAAGEAADLPKRVLGDAWAAGLAPTEIRMKVDPDTQLVQAVTFGQQRKGGKHDQFGPTESNKSKTTNQVIDPLHVDGTKAFGYSAPDFILLFCAVPCPTGGANFVVDGEAVLQSMREHPDHAWVADAVFSRPVRQLYFSVTATGKGVWEGPLAIRHESGRLQWQCPNVFDACEPRVVPLESSDDRERDQAMIDIFAEHMRAAQASAARFKLDAGDCLVVDNYRMSHGREPFTSLDRTLWRMWTWSTRSSGGIPADVLADRTARRDCDI
ncbi:TauD domain-containing protein, partial [Durusdinium trenchii]